MLIVHKGKIITNKRVGVEVCPEVPIDVVLNDADQFAKEVCEKGICTSRAEGRRLFHKQSKEKINE